MPLTTETLTGMWAGLPVPWTTQDEIDEAALRENVRRICRAGAHGVYTHGTTGEFYAQTEEEWKRVVRATVEECRSEGKPCQIGCTALWTTEVIRRVGFAQQMGADGVQIAFPFWLELTDDQAVRFLRDVASAVPEIPFILYNTTRSKKPLTVDLLRRSLDAGIPIVGCKGVQNKQELQEFLKIGPKLKFFVGEYELASHWSPGARGCYSSFVYACPRFMLRYFDLCEQGSKEAQHIEGGLKRFIAEYVMPLTRRGMYDTALDRCFAVMTGFLTGNLLQSRQPYDAPTQKDVNDCREWCSNNLSEFVTGV
jgi:4-hydroxy-tetrahydrodipicolinate synthase